MTIAIGQTGGVEGDRPTGTLGHHRAVGENRGVSLHVDFDGVAASALCLVITRGRAPSVSLVTAARRQGVLPEIVVSQSDLPVSHRPTARNDVEALYRAQSTDATTSIREVLSDSWGRSQSSTARSRPCAPHRSGNAAIDSRVAGRDEAADGGGGT